MVDFSFKKSLLLFGIALILIELIVYKDFLFGEQLFLYKDLGDDSYVTAYPNLYAKIQALKIGELPSWDFSTGLGENMYPFWLEPIALFITYFFFKSNVAESMIWIQLTYSFLAGIFFFSFLRNLKIHTIPAAIFSHLYVFSGYMIVHSTWVHLEFANNVMMFAFLLFAWERFIFKRQWFYFPLSIALLGISYTPVNVYFAAILILLFMFLIFPSHYKNSWKSWFIDSGRLILMGVIGLGMSSFLLLSNLNLMSNSPRGSGAFSGLLEIPSPFQMANTSELQTSFLRLFSPNLEGIADDFSGWMNYFEAPIWYCGLIVLLLIPQLFHFITKKERLIYGILLGVFLIIAVFPFFRISVWFYSGDYYRILSLLFGITMLYLSGKALDHIIRQKLLFTKTLIITLSIILIALFLMRSGFSDFAAPNPSIIFILLIGYAIVLWFWGRKNQSNTSLYVLMGIVVCEILLFTSPTLEERKIVTESDIKDGVGYQDATLLALADIKKKERDFMRIEKDYFSGISRDASFNESKIQGFYGSRTYNSFSNVNYINFLKCIGELGELTEESTRWVRGISNSPNAMRICSVKYLLTRSEDLKDSVNFNIIGENKGIKTLELKNSLPFGFTYDTYMDVESFDKLSRIEKEQLLPSVAVLDESDVPNEHGLQEFSSRKNDSNHSKDYLKMSSFSNAYIEGSINSSKAQLLFLSIPFDKGWQLKIDGVNTKMHKVFGGLTGAFISKGDHSLVLSFEDPYKKMGTILSIIFLVLYILLIYIVNVRQISLLRNSN